MECSVGVTALHDPQNLSSLEEYDYSSSGGYHSISQGLLYLYSFCMYHLLWPVLNPLMMLPRICGLHFQLTGSKPFTHVRQNYDTEQKSSKMFCRNCEYFQQMLWMLMRYLFLEECHLCVLWQLWALVLTGATWNEWHGKQSGELAVMMCKMKFQFFEWFTFWGLDFPTVPTVQHTFTLSFFSEAWFTELMWFECCKINKELLRCFVGFC